MSRIGKMKVSEKKVVANRANARRSTGPRTPEGKRRTARNAYKHGLYANSFEEAMKALKEDEGLFRQLHEGLRESVEPRNTLEELLVGDLAKLWWKKARVERAQTAHQARAVEDWELERLKRLQELNRDDVHETLEEIKAHGLRGGPPSAAKYREVLDILEAILDYLQRRDWSQGLDPAFKALYGENPGWRGRTLIALYHELRAADESGGVQPRNLEAEENGSVELILASQPQDPNWDEFVELRQALLEEQRDVISEYETMLAMETRVTPAMLVARLAPLETGPWTLILRQEAALERQLDRKLRLLLKIRQEWREGPGTGTGSRKLGTGRRQEEVEELRSRRVEAAAEAARGCMPAKMKEQSQEVVEKKGSPRRPVESPKLRVERRKPEVGGRGAQRKWKMDTGNYR